MMQWIVFTDLDGTLLDAVTYSPEEARDALQRVQAAAIPIVFCSAKTYIEQAPIRSDLNVTDPCIVENGSAIVWPDGGRTVFGVEANVIHNQLRQIMAETGLSLETFQDVSVQRIAQITGLDLAAAARAQQRDYSATVFTQLSSGDLDAFQAACDARQLKAPSGGRFLTVTGKDADKGVAVRDLIKHYQQHFDAISTVGIGDSPNDGPMLAAVDDAYQVQRPDKTWGRIAVPQLQRVNAVGPEGWAQVMKTFLEQLRG